MSLALIRARSPRRVARGEMLAACARSCWAAVRTSSWSLAATYMMRSSLPQEALDSQPPLGRAPRTLQS